MVSSEISKLATNPHATGEDVTTWKGKLNRQGDNNVRIDVCVKAIGKVYKVSIVLPRLKQAFGQHSSGVIWSDHVIGEIEPPKHLAVFWCHTQPSPDSHGVDAERGRDEISAGAP